MTTDITELAQRMKAAAMRAKAATEDYVAHRMSITVCLAECKEFNDLSDGPDKILALVEALELKEEQRANWFQMAQKLGEDLDAAEKRIAELESRTVTVKQYDEFQICHYGATEDYAKGYIDCQNNFFKWLTAAGIKWEAE
ncbi:hypothetical protein QK313_28820 [Klebsiella michiganensis]|uniref:hypothetical protein n=1 Tax=Klebsiella michiganensis TaxID=1134687 RepID=UPI001F2C3817|nr:hypothetical protein [Klebsiella michiganensis]MDI3171898.1 hypothetical protein [Klebsiella michiganensis]UIU16108.1 hypothetical protein LLZ89_17955 [Klebsiella michiganensis]